MVDDDKRRFRFINRLRVRLANSLEHLPMPEKLKARLFTFILPRHTVEAISRISRGIMESHRQATLIIKSLCDNTPSLVALFKKRNIETLEGGQITRMYGLLCMKDFIPDIKNLAMVFTTYAYDQATFQATLKLFATYPAVLEREGFLDSVTGEFQSLNYDRPVILNMLAHEWANALRETGSEQYVTLESRLYSLLTLQP